MPADPFTTLGIVTTFTSSAKETRLCFAGGPWLRPCGTLKEVEVEDEDEGDEVEDVATVAVSVCWKKLQSSSSVAFGWVACSACFSSDQFRNDQPPAAAALPVDAAASFLPNEAAQSSGSASILAFFAAGGALSSFAGGRSIYQLSIGQKERFRRRTFFFSFSFEKKKKLF
jgi:hypothetical protein